MPINIVYKAANLGAYTANAGETVVVTNGTGAQAFTVTLPRADLSTSSPVAAGPATQANATPGVGVSPTSSGLVVNVVNQMTSADSITVKTSDGSKVAGLTGSTGVYITESNSGQFVNDGVGPQASNSNWVQIGGQAAGAA